MFHLPPEFWGDLRDFNRFDGDFNYAFAGGVASVGYWSGGLMGLLPKTPGLRPNSRRIV